MTEVVDSGKIVWLSPNRFYGYLTADDSDGAGILFFLQDAWPGLKVGDRCLFGYLIDGRKVRAAPVIRPWRPTRTR
jgi:hypothetical protein